MTFQESIIREDADVAEYAAMCGIPYLLAVAVHWQRGHWWIRQQIGASVPSVFRAARREVVEVQS